MKVRVKNFQSIADAEIEIDGFTVITGSNNSGKTALIRALRGAFQNTGGNTFVRHGTDACRVEVDLGDADFSWEKGHKIKPTYEIASKTLHPGREIPKEITDLGVRSIVAGGREIYPQIANQFTGQVFLVDQPGSVLAEAVADVERVGKLNRSLKLAEKDKRSASSELKVRKKDLKTYEEELLLFDGVDNVENVVDKCESLLTATNKIAGWVDGLTSLRERYRTANDVVEALSGVRDTFDEFEETDQSVLDLRSMISELRDLRSLRDRYQQAASELNQAEQAVASVETVSIPPTAVLTKLSKALTTFSGFRVKYTTTKDQVDSLGGDIQSAEKQLLSLEEEISETLGEIGECPTCGTPYSDCSASSSVMNGEIGRAS